MEDEDMEVLSGGSRGGAGGGGRKRSSVVCRVIRNTAAPQI